ncbi:MAG: hypothetical protein NT030_00210 [Candidatus Saganbacteria bacterium]|nr:hypothetical protein [Candidatus Saganbacteria bacterium]
MMPIGEAKFNGIKTPDTRSPQLRSALRNIRRSVYGPIKISINGFGAVRKSFKLEIIPSDILTKLKITNKISSNEYQFKTEVLTLDHFTGELEYDAENFNFEANTRIKSSPGDKKYPIHLEKILAPILGREVDEKSTPRPPHWQEMTKDLFINKNYFTKDQIKTITFLSRKITRLKNLMI